MQLHGIQNLSFWKNHLFLPVLYLEKRKKNPKHLLLIIFQTHLSSSPNSSTTEPDVQCFSCSRGKGNDSIRDPTQSKHLLCLDARMGLLLSQPNLSYGLRDTTPCCINTNIGNISRRFRNLSLCQGVGRHLPQDSPFLKFHFGLSACFTLQSRVSEYILVDNGFVQRNINRIPGQRHNGDKYVTELDALLPSLDAALDAHTAITKI